MNEAQTQETLQIEGMTCANCALGIQQVLRKKGLGDAEVSFAAAVRLFSLLFPAIRRMKSKKTSSILGTA
ncbi:MAG: hypothetical protein R2850_11075 [Bacteroidia bacterium]